MEKWPNLFIVGAPKAGTSSLYAYLSNIPGIFMPKIKEPNYFSVNTIPNNSRVRPIRDKSKYIKLFKKVKNEKIIGDASPSYLSDPAAPKLIHEIVPDARIIISLRDPVERTLSYYLMHLRNGLLKGTFHEELQKSLKLCRVYNIRSLRLETGLYAEDVQRYLDLFGKKQVKILIFEEFIKDTKKTLNDVLSFLDVDYEMNNFEGEAYNKFGVARGSISKFLLRNIRIRRVAEKIISPSGRRVFRENILLKKGEKPKMSQEDRNTLIKFYNEDVIKLQKNLGRKLPWKNFQK